MTPTTTPTPTDNLNLAGQMYDRLMGEAAAERAAVDASVAAARLGVSLSMIYKLARQGRLEGYAVGRRKLFYVDSIAALRQRNAFGGAQNTTTLAAAEEPKPRASRTRRAPRPITLPASRHLR